MKWDDSIYVKAYDLARQGMANKTIARTLGTNAVTFSKWMKKRPALREALEEARKGASGKGTSLQEYIYDKLPGKLKLLWEKIMSWQEDPYGVDKTEKLLSKKGRIIRQHLFLYALVEGNFNVSQACSTVNISKSTFKTWVNADPDFARLIDEIHWHKKNLIEGCLIKLVRNGDSAATIFVNKTINRDRGYNDKQVSEVNVSVTGEVKHRHVATLADLGLSLEARKEILQKMRQSEQAAEKKTLALTHEQDYDTIDAEVEE